MFKLIGWVAGGALAIGVLSLFYEAHQHQREGIALISIVVSSGGIGLILGAIADGIREQGTGW